jgi:hypothetical protein
MSMLAMACCHHQTWHRSFDFYNLNKAYEFYTEAFKVVDSPKDDPNMLFDFALVFVETGQYVAGLEILGHVISVFPHFEHFRLALLWTGA